MRTNRKFPARIAGTVTIAVTSALVTVAIAPAQASAQSAPPTPTLAADAPVVVDVQPGTASVDPAAVRSAIARELGAPAVAVGDALPGSARGTLRIVGDGDHRIVMTFRDASGREVWRVVSIPRDPVATIATIAFLAGNLARDEADDIAMQLQPVVVAPVIPSEPAVVALPPPIATERIELATTPPVPEPATIVTPLAPRVSRPIVRDRHTAPLGFFLAGGVGRTEVGTGAALITGINYRITDRLLVEMVYGQGQTARASTDFQLAEGRYWTGPMLAVRLPVGYLRFEAGVGLAFLVDELYSATNTPPSSLWYTAQSTTYTVAAQARVGAYLALLPHFDVFAMGFGTVSGGNSAEFNGVSVNTYWFATAMLGMQLRAL